MNVRTIRKPIAALLILALTVLVFPVFNANAGTPVYVIAASDFQYGTHEGGAAVVTSIAESIRRDGFTDVEGFLFSGDYDKNTIGNSTETAAGLAALDAAIDAAFPTLETKVYAQGNHDPASVAGLASSGAHDSASYGVFVINNKDYMWYNSDETTIRQTAASLRAYLEDKENEEYKKPIFVVSHLPLHYSMRTSVDGDAQYANYIFDELNEAGALGLNIVFLFGHDHSHGWDNYLGGSAIFLEKGDRINIAQASRTVFREETLNFYYMNAGYTGYYSSAYGADDTLTMTLFEIDGSSLTIRRYDAAGLHPLKGAGTYCGEYDDRSLLPSDTTVYESPLTAQLSSTVLSKSWYEDDAVGIAAYYTGSGIEVEETADDDARDFFGDPDAFVSYLTYTVSPVGENIGTAKLRVPYDEFGDEPVRLYLKNGSSYERVKTTEENGRLVFTAHLPVTITLAVPNDPVARSEYADLLFTLEGSGTALHLLHLSGERYLSCDGNATYATTPADLTITSVGGGFKISLTNDTGGKAAGDALHFGTANRCSFGTYSPFVFYEFSPGDLFFISEQPEAGKTYLIAYVSGSASYALSGRVNGSGSSARIETEAVTLTLSDPDRLAFANSAFLPYLYKAEGTDGSYTFKNVDTSSYLGCGGNATLSSAPVAHNVEAYGSGVKIALSEATGGKAAGEALHLGTGERVSYGSASTVSLYEYAGNDTFRLVDAPKSGSYYLIVFVSGEQTRALSGRVYNPGSSSRIETDAVEIPIAVYYHPCDLDRDGVVSISDVSVLLDCLTHDLKITPAGADPDVSGNGVVSIVDVTWLLDRLST